jgi:hypothetical protein
MNRIQSNEYFDVVKAYSLDHKDPARVYRFLMDTLQADKQIPYEEMLYQHVDMLEKTEGYIRFYSGTECILVLLFTPGEQSSKSVSSICVPKV